MLQKTAELANEISWVEIFS